MTDRFTILKRRDNFDCLVIGFGKVWYTDSSASGTLVSSGLVVVRD